MYRQHAMTVRGTWEAVAVKHWVTGNTSLVLSGCLQAGCLCAVWAMLDSLPPELLFEILLLCPPPTICAAAITCKTLNRAAGDPYLWRRIYRGLLPLHSNDVPPPVWRPVRSEDWKLRTMSLLSLVGGDGERGRDTQILIRLPTQSVVFLPPSMGLDTLVVELIRFVAEAANVGDVRDIRVEVDGLSLLTTNQRLDHLSLWDVGVLLRSTIVVKLKLGREVSDLSESEEYATWNNLADHRNSVRTFASIVGVPYSTLITGIVSSRRSALEQLDIPADHLVPHRFAVGFPLDGVIQVSLVQIDLMASVIDTLFSNTDPITHECRGVAGDALCVVCVGGMAGEGGEVEVEGRVLFDVVTCTLVFIPASRLDPHSVFSIHLTLPHLPQHPQHTPWLFAT